MSVLQGLCSYNGLLYAAWKGKTEDDRLFHSAFNERYWSEQRYVGGNSSAGPAIANFAGKVVLAWKGKYSDQRLFSVQVDNGLWSYQAQIPRFASSTGPSLAEYNNNLYAAWKGAEADQAIWYARYNGSTWSPQAVIPGVATSVAPALCTYNGRLYAAWKGWNNDQGLWYSAFDGNRWSPQQIIPNVASSVGPSLAVYDGKLFAAWKGVTGDESIWYASFDGKSWSAQRVIPNVGSSMGPALSQFAGKLYAMWKGAGDDQQLYYSRFDGATWAPQERVPGNTGQDTPQNIGLRMQFQQTSLWCWIAVGVSVAHYYGQTKATQCRTMTQIGQTINGWPPTTVCCPRFSRLTPATQKSLVNPYDAKSENALDRAGLPPVCIKSGGVNDAMKVTNNWASNHSSLSLGEIAGEINNRRPVVVAIQWNGGGQHVVAVAGLLNEQLLVVDPANGESVIRYQDFPAQYAGGATVVSYMKTKAG